MRKLFEVIERTLDRVCPESANPMRHLGALGIYFLWIVSVTGGYLFIFFDTGTTEAFLSVEDLTTTQWYLGGVARSLHRYASDGMVVFAALHMAREFAFGRYRGPRWFTWMTGIPIVWLLAAAGITGYWLVWDKLAQYVAIASSELLDALPLFGGLLVRNFTSPSLLTDRFFTLLIFLHIAVPLILVFVLWVHLQRVAHADISPVRRLAVPMLAVLLAISFVAPAVSQGAANLLMAPSPIRPDWFYLWPFPLADRIGADVTWSVAGLGTLLLCVLPWLPPLKKAAPAVVNLAECNGCTRCAADCPVSAIEMVPRGDGRPFRLEAKVDVGVCTRCGICMGACPTASPFRQAHELVAGIFLPDQPLADVVERLRCATEDLSGAGRLLVLTCEAGPPRLAGLKNTGVVTLPCVAMAPPALVDFALSRHLVDGVVVLGCGPGQCGQRLGGEWMRQRLARTRDPHLRSRIASDRCLTIWAGSIESARAIREIAEFQGQVADLPPFRLGAVR